MTSVLHLNFKLSDFLIAFLFISVPSRFGLGSCCVQLTLVSDITFLNTWDSKRENVPFSAPSALFMHSLGQTLLPQSQEQTWRSSKMRIPPIQLPLTERNYSDFFPHLFLAEPGKRFKFEHLHSRDKSHTDTVNPGMDCFIPRNYWGKKQIALTFKEKNWGKNLKM